MTASYLPQGVSGLAVPRFEEVGDPSLRVMWVCACLGGHRLALRACECTKGWARGPQIQLSPSCLDAEASGTCCVAGLSLKA